MKKLKTKYQRVADIEIAYTECGKGPVLLLLHGNSENKSIFGKYQAEYFSDYHTYALDSRGHGESVSTDSRYTIKQYSADVIGFCKALGIDKAAVIGYSDGGNIALSLAIAAPETFGKVIAVSPNYLVSGTVDKWLSLFKKTYAAMALLDKIGIDMKKPMMRFELMLNDTGITEEDLRQIKTKVGILYAERDMIKEDHIAEIHRNIPDSKLIKVSGCNHMSILKKEEAIKEMRGYLESHK